VAQVLGDSSPFSEDVLSLNEAQLDFILTMRSRDRPNELKFERRRDMLARIASQNKLTGQANVLTGAARADLQKRVAFTLPAAYRTKGFVQTAAMPPPKAPTLSPRVAPRAPRMPKKG
jgi:hypothetical protein